MKDLETYKQLLIEKIEMQMDTLNEMLECLNNDNIEDLTNAFSYHYQHDNKSLQYWFYQYLLERNKK